MSRRIHAADLAPVSRAVDPHPVSHSLGAGGSAVEVPAIVASVVAWLRRGYPEGLPVND